MGVGWNTRPLHWHWLNSDVPKQKLTVVATTYDCVIWKGEKLSRSNGRLAKTVELRPVLERRVPKQSHTHMVLNCTVLVLRIWRQQQVRNLRRPVQISDHSVHCVVMIDESDSVRQNIVLVSKFYSIHTFILTWNRLSESVQAYRRRHGPTPFPKI